MTRSKANQSPPPPQGTNNNNPSTAERKLPKRGRSRRARISINSSLNRRSLNESFSSPTNDSNNNLTNEEPFIVLFLKVGVTLFLFSTVSYLVFVQNTWWSNPNFNDHRFRESQGLMEENAPRNQPSLHNNAGQPKRNAVKPALKEKAVKIQKKSLVDAYDIASNYGLYQLQETNNNITTNNSSDTKVEETVSIQTPSLFEQKAADIRFQFENLVGGTDHARETLQRSLFGFIPRQDEKETPLEKDNNFLAWRLRKLSSKSNHDEKRKISAVVLGSSAAAGSGNYYHQSYAFVLEQIMAPVFESLGIDFQVKNLAIEHTAEFPFLWCLEHHLGADSFPDIIVWDYGWYSTPESFEAFIRNVAGKARDNGQQPPLLIFRDSKQPNNNDQRDTLIQAYVDHTIIVGPLLLHVDQAAAPFLRLPDKDIPTGFQSWTTSFGGPQGAPGKEHTHLTVKQHEMVAWLISMHLLSALQLAVADQANADSVIFSAWEDQLRSPDALLPPPVAIQRSSRSRWFLDQENEDEMIEKAPPAWLPLLVGVPDTQPEHIMSRDGKNVQADLDGGLFHYPRSLHCRTSYITQTTADDLEALIVSGSVAQGPLNLEEFHQNNTQLLEDLLLPKGVMFMKDGWVQDMDKTTKRKMQLSKQFNFLGFEDMIKKAYFGLPNSGDLKFFIPLSTSAQQKALAAFRETGRMPAQDFIETVLICETDLPKTLAPDDSKDPNFKPDECRLHQDAYIHVGGENGELAFQETIPSGVSSSCVFLNVPDGSMLAFKNELIDKKDNSNLRGKTGNEEDEEVGNDVIGLPVTIRVRADRGGLKAPCSVANVLWQEQELDND